MQFLTVGEFKEKIIPKLHGHTFDELAGTPEDKLYEAGLSMLARIDPDATIRRYRIANAIYSDIFRYTCPQDCKGKQKILDLRPIGPRAQTDITEGRFSREFDRRKAVDTLNIETINGVRTLRISKDVSDVTTLFEADSVTGVTALGDASNLTTDALDFVSGISSIRFDLDGATGQGGVAITLAAAVDLSLLEDLGALFSWLEYPADDLTSVKIRFGTDASNYWERTVTAPYDRTDFEEDAWTLQAFNWQDTTEVGTPDASAVSYIEVYLNYTAGTAHTGVGLDNITASLGAAYELVYYSNAIFLGTDGVYRTKPVSDDDEITLDDSANLILLYEFLRIAYPELKGKNMAADMINVNYRLEGDGRKGRGTTEPNYGGLYNYYVQGSPSEAQSHSETYHDFDSLSGE